MMGKPFIPSRRDVLKTSGALIVSFSFIGAARQAFAQDAIAAKPLALTAVDSFLAIDSGGAVTIYSGKVDLGTGVRTALTQVAAEELDVPLSKVIVVQGDTALTPDQGPTFGSLAIQIGGVQIRNACAVARSALLELAAKQLGASVADLKVADGVVRSGDRQVNYGELLRRRCRSHLLLRRDARDEYAHRRQSYHRPERLRLARRLTGWCSAQRNGWAPMMF
jgi:nicotinate dehydrogenase subunit B